MTAAWRAGTLKAPERVFDDGGWIVPQSGRMLDVVSPVTEERILSYPEAGVPKIDRSMPCSAPGRTRPRRGHPGCRPAPRAAWGGGPPPPRNPQPRAAPNPTAHTVAADRLETARLDAEAGLATRRAEIEALRHRIVAEMVKPAE